MPRRRLLTPAERAGLLAFPTTDEALVQQYTFSEPDLAAIGQRRGEHNRLGFAVQLCYLRYPGFALPPDAQPPAALLALAGRQLGIDPRRLGAVRPAPGDPARAPRAIAGLVEPDPVHRGRLPARGAPTRRTGPADRSRYRPGRSPGRAAASAADRPAGARCHRAGLQRGARPRHALGLCGADRAPVGASPARTRRPADAARRPPRTAA